MKKLQQKQLIFRFQAITTQYPKRMGWAQVRHLHTLGFILRNFQHSTLPHNLAGQMKASHQPAHRLCTVQYKIINVAKTIRVTFKPSWFRFFATWAFGESVFDKSFQLLTKKGSSKTRDQIRVAQREGISHQGKTCIGLSSYKRDLSCRISAPSPQAVCLSCHHLEI